MTVSSFILVSQDHIRYDSARIECDESEPIILGIAQAHPPLSEFAAAAKIGFELEWTQIEESARSNFEVTRIIRLPPSPMALYILDRLKFNGIHASTIFID